jgi:YEATS domain-containing protein 4
MYEILTSKGTAKLPSRSRGARGEFLEETERAELNRLDEGVKTVQEQIKIVREKLKDREKQMAEIKKALEK